MATRTFCDGCATECGDADLTTVGRYDPVVFCADCLTAWKEYEAAERARHAQLVRDFEGWRKDARAAMKGKEEPTTLVGGPIEGPITEVTGATMHGRAPMPARRTLARLPDEE